MNRPLIAGVLALAAFVAPAVRADDPVAVTTDSFAYCHDLARRLPQAHDSDDALRDQATSRLPSTKSENAEIERLRREGMSMCEAGRIRGGIIRLRRALMMEREAPSPSG